MPQIGWFEILIIVSVAIIVVGPKDFPIIIKKIGSWVGSFKRAISNIQTEVSRVYTFYVRIRVRNFLIFL